MSHQAPRNVRVRVDPRDVPAVKAARRMGLTLQAFELVREELVARGFPVPDQTTGLYDLVAIDTWMDSRCGQKNNSSLTNGKPLRDPAQGFQDRARQLFHGQR